MYLGNMSYMTALTMIPTYYVKKKMSGNWETTHLVACSSWRSSCAFIMLIQRHFEKCDRKKGAQAILRRSWSRGNAGYWGES
jgi:hypothetical protein